jgi:hypothetical protein
MTELTPDERAELERLRREEAGRRGRAWARASRWVGAVVV